MNPDLSALVAAYRASESDESRGPLFKAAPLAIEEEMKTRVVTRNELLGYFGPPDRYDDNTFLYIFDHVRAGGSKDEWYFQFTGEHLASSGYNVRGINDLFGMRSRHQFVRENQ